MHAADRAEREGFAPTRRSLPQRPGMLDSSWVSPGARRRILLPLAGRAARFYLSRAVSAPREDFISAYLWPILAIRVAEQWCSMPSGKEDCETSTRTWPIGSETPTPQRSHPARGGAALLGAGAHRLPRAANLPPAVR